MFTNENKITFDDATIDQKIEILRAKEQNQCDSWSHFDEQWIQKIGNTFASNQIYRVRPPQLPMMPGHIWDSIRPEYRWIVYDGSNAEWSYACIEKPSYNGIAWDSGADITVAIGFMNLPDASSIPSSQCIWERP